MSDEHITGGYEHDLREAENAMAAAGHPDIALGMRRHSEAQRNMMQGVLVPMFVTMVERALDAKLAPVSDQIGGLRGDTTALQAEFRDGLSGVQRTVSTLAETIDGISTRVGDVETRMDTIEAVQAAFRKEFADYAAANKRSDVDKLKVQMGELIAERGEYTPEERARLLKSFLELLAWWDAGRPDGKAQASDGS